MHDTLCVSAILNADQKNKNKAEYKNALCLVFIPIADTKLTGFIR